MPNNSSKISAHGFVLPLATLKTLRSLAIISRPEFLPANLGSLVMGFAWSISPPLESIGKTIVLLALCFLVLTFVSAIGAQTNTLSDCELDRTDPHKRRLVEAFCSMGSKRLKSIMIVEFLLSLPVISALLLIQPKPILLLLWIAGNTLGHVYSMPPLRLKSKSWLAMLSLFLVLSILPITFIYLSFASELNPLFLLFLTGQAMSVYAIIIPTEIRDYFVDKAMNVKTMTVYLGLSKATLLAIILLTTGAALMGTAFIIQLTRNLQPILSIFLVVMIAADIFVLKQYRTLYSLSKKHSPIENPSSTAEDITNLAAHNPQWITTISQTIVLMSIILLISKFTLQP